MESGVRRGHSRVHCGLQQNLFEIARFEFVLQTRSYVQAELFPPSGGGSNRKHKQPPRSPIETGTRPDRAPGKPRDQILEAAIEIGRCRGSAIDMLIAEYFAPDLRPVVSILPEGSRAAPPRTSEAARDSTE